MLKINREDQSFSLLDAPTLADVSITERYDLQEFISNSPDAFFKEISQDLFLIGKEIEPSTMVADRIDLLAIDKEGTCVVVELKRGSNKLQMFQAITYAGMISQWNSDDFFEFLDENQQDALVDFLDVDREEINRRQRIILVAEAYDYALLAGTEWLSARHDVDIICCRISIAKDAATESEYLVCSNVYPAPELSQEAITRGRKTSGVSSLKWSDWDSALANVSNPDVVSYFKQELAAQRESYLRKRILRYRASGKRRWFVAVRNKHAYVWQYGRFPDDIRFWQERISGRDKVEPKKSGETLSFYLHTADDFRSFHDAVSQTLQSTEWEVGASDDETDAMESDE